jgi:hypothetical protein
MLDIPFRTQVSLSPEQSTLKFNLREMSKTSLSAKLNILVFVTTAVSNWTALVFNFNFKFKFCLFYIKRELLFRISEISIWECSKVEQ